MSEVHDEIRAILSSQESPELEELETEDQSPLNEPVVNDELPDSEKEESDEEDDRGDIVFHPDEIEEVEEPLDAEEQEIDEDYDDSSMDQEEEEFEVPTGHARQAANTILGMTDNLLAVGGGFFVKIKKHKEFYEFEEIIQVIDGQNQKNVKRIKLDAEDKALLRPLLIAMLKKKAKKLTPEQQLMGALISIMMKKAQVVMEIKAENDILTQRILDIIRQEKGYSEQDEDTDESVTGGSEEDQDEEITPVEVLEVADDPV